MANRGVAQALYLYGISRSADAKASKVANPGIDGVHPVQSISCGNFLCWVSAIDHAGFSQEITRNMENLEWLALHSVRHQQEVGARSTIIPARFGTVFSGEPALVKDVLGRKSALEKVFARISDADEWGVKVFGEQQEPPEKTKKVRSGTEYLQRKAAHLKRRPDVSGLTEFAAALEEIATDSAPSGK